MLDKTALQQSRDRWQLVAQYERKEGSQQSDLDRWQKLNALIRMAADLDLVKDVDSQDEAQVWNRWNQLRELYLASTHS
ncbi:MAG: hypothetical protein KC445_15115 [Anaerolineales bacterium]|nr:hypothetical protein [Anaerolineales bacterium]